MTHKHTGKKGYGSCHLNKKFENPLPLIPVRNYAMKSIKTMSIENVSKGVLDKNKEHYSRCKDKAEKSYDVSRQIQVHMSKYKTKWRFTIHYVKPTTQLLSKSLFPKIGPTYRLLHDTKRHKDNQLQRLKLLCRIFYTHQKKFSNTWLWNRGSRNYS